MTKGKTSIPLICLNKAIVMAVILGFTLSNCSSLKIMETEAYSLADEMSMTSPTSKNWQITGDTLATRIEQTIINERPNIRSANSSLAISGGIVSFIGVVSASVIGATSNDNTKTGVGLSATILTASVGIYQVWTGTKKDAAEYVRDAGEIISGWKASIAVANDEAMKQEAYIAFLRETAKLQAKYPGFASFRIADLE